ncbi:MAG: AMP-binding protein, partial [Casimicrobiaceae bacterium]
MTPRFDHEPLTPTAFLERAGTVFADRVGVVEGTTRYTWVQFRERCLHFAGALRDAGIEPGDRVAVLAPNSQVLLAAHHAVPWAGAVLVALNTRITAADVAWILDHSGARLLIYDAAFAATAVDAIAKAASRID